uniref:helix-turn-helix transcriptional regulator n=1 Tax=Streptomyces polyasparticus TaxID=2767826 RepID=UPI001BE454CA|nr:helix-turn-helix transcriptional regulator [Streptomyces polyasparticus]
MPRIWRSARRALLAGEAADPDGPYAPGLLILTAALDVESVTPGVERWMRELPDGDFDAGRLPSVVPALAGRVLRTAEHPGRPGEMTVARVLSSSGTWLVLHGACLQSAGPPRIAIIIEPARPARIHSLLMSAYSLTAREREVTSHILQGSSTAEVAQDLVISVHTVRQHLKSIFGKADVRSRRDLVAKVFYGHYEPRLRDNEQRTVAGKPVRGGPKA